MQCHREAALAWKGTHTAQAREGFPPCPPLRSTCSLVSSSRPSPSHRKRRVSASSRMSLLRLPSVRCLLPRFLPSSSPLSPEPPTFSPGSFPAADNTCRAPPALCKPCLEPASSSGYSHPSPSPLCLEEVVSPPRRSLAPELAVTLLLPARGCKRSH